MQMALNDEHFTLQNAITHASRIRKDFIASCGLAIGK